MSPESSQSPCPDAVGREAAAWVVREERGLTPVEQDALSQWLASDPRHPAALRERRWAWREFDRIAGLPAKVAAAPDPDLLAPRSVPRRRGRVWTLVFVGTTAAAAAVFVLFALSRPPPAAAVRFLSTALAAPCERRTLEDGSTIELNRGARVTVDYTTELRRVRLERGEAHFVVAKNFGRPFVVEAGGVTVRAVGTAFNVRLTADVEVVVTEGRVALGRAQGSADPAPVLEARQRAVLPLDGPAPTAVATLSEADLGALLVWQPRLLDFSDMPLAAVVDILNRRNPVQLVLGAPSLRELRINASIRSDNVEGFVHLLGTGFDLRAVWRSETQIVLYPAR